MDKQFLCFFICITYVSPSSPNTITECFDLQDKSTTTDYSIDCFSGKIFHISVKAGVKPVCRNRCDDVTSSGAIGLKNDHCCLLQKGDCFEDGPNWKAKCEGKSSCTIPVESKILKSCRHNQYMQKLNETIFSSFLVIEYTCDGDNTNFSSSGSLHTTKSGQLTSVQQVFSKSSESKTTPTIRQSDPPNSINNKIIDSSSANHDSYSTSPPKSNTISGVHGSSTNSLVSTSSSVSGVQSFSTKSSLEKPKAAGSSVSESTHDHGHLNSKIKNADKDKESDNTNYMWLLVIIGAVLPLLWAGVKRLKKKASVKPLKNEKDSTNTMESRTDGAFFPNAFKSGADIISGAPPVGFQLNSISKNHQSFFPDRGQVKDTILDGKKTGISPNTIMLPPIVNSHETDEDKMTMEKKRKKSKKKRKHKRKGKNNGDMATGGETPVENFSDQKILITE